MGRYLGSRLLDLKSRHSFIKDVRGMGLLWGVEFDIDVAPSIYLILLKIVKPDLLVPMGNVGQFKIISFKDKVDWQLVPKYNIGVKY